MIITHQVLSPETLVAFCFAWGIAVRLAITVTMRLVRRARL